MSDFYAIRQVVQYVRQIKLFNLMNCFSSWMPDKLQGSLPPSPKKDPSTALGTLIVMSKISRKWWMSRG